MSATTPAKKDKLSNPMRELKLAKLIVHCCVGESGDRLTRASKVLEQLTGQKVVTGKARYTLRGFGIRRNEKISCHVTVRGDKATEILERGLKVKEFELLDKNFSANGNFGFGINEHIDLGLCVVALSISLFARVATHRIASRCVACGAAVHCARRGEGPRWRRWKGTDAPHHSRYDPSSGIFGLDIYCVLTRAGARVAKRKVQQGVVGKKHQISKQEAQQWFVQKFDGLISKE